MFQSSCNKSGELIAGGVKQESGIVSRELGAGKRKAEQRFTDRMK